MRLRTSLRSFCFFLSRVYSSPGGMMQPESLLSRSTWTCGVDEHKPCVLCMMMCFFVSLSDAKAEPRGTRDICCRVCPFSSLCLLPAFPTSSRNCRCAPAPACSCSLLLRCRSGSGRVPFQRRSRQRSAESSFKSKSDPLGLKTTWLYAAAPD